MEELRAGAHAFLSGEPFEPKALPHPAAFNVFCHDSDVGEDGYNFEERKMLLETRARLRR